MTEGNYKVGEFRVKMAPAVSEESWAKKVQEVQEQRAQELARQTAEDVQRIEAERAERARRIEEGAAARRDALIETIERTGGMGRAGGGKYSEMHGNEGLTWTDGALHPEGGRTAF